MIKSRTDDAERECKSPLYGEKKKLILTMNFKITTTVYSGRQWFFIRGYIGTANLLKECEVIMSLPYIVKYALLRVAVPYL